MQFFLMTEPQLGGGYDQLSWAARYAEDAGLTGFARSDHYYWRAGEPKAATEALTSLGGLARDTSRIRLAVLVSPITFRHPSNLAKSAATLDQMSSGRFDLGLGTGWMEQEHETFGIDFPDLVGTVCPPRGKPGLCPSGLLGGGLRGEVLPAVGRGAPPTEWGPPHRRWIWTREDTQPGGKVCRRVQPFRQLGRGDWRPSWRR